MGMAKSYLKVSVTSDDVIIGAMIDYVTMAAERYTGRDLRVNTWLAYADDFESSWCIARNVVDSIDQMSYKVDGSYVTITPATYELKVRTIWSELSTAYDKSWPSNIDTAADAVRIKFTTRPDPKLTEVMVCMYKHLAYAYENRGDDDFSSNGMRNANESKFYTPVSIPRH